MKKNLADAVNRAPETCGVYLFKNGDGAVLYIGKAKNLKARLKSYVRPGGDGRISIQFLERQAEAIETVVTQTEGEAILLEDSLVKKHQPPHNVRLKDDKSFLMIRFDTRQAFPRLEPIRSRSKKDRGPHYFGPYASTSAIRRTLNTIQGLLPLRDCTDQMMNHRSRPCLKFQIGRCAAPCTGEIGEKEYGDLAAQAVDILKGKTTAIEKQLEEKMQGEADKLRFERAAVLRDQLAALRTAVEKQQVTKHRGIDRDVLGLYRKDGKAVLSLLRYRKGQLEDTRYHFLSTSLPEENIFSDYLARLYTAQDQVPVEILVPSLPTELDMLEGWLGKKSGHGVSIAVPQKGDRVEQLNMAQANARQMHFQSTRKGEELSITLDLLQDRLGLPEKPETIDCFDISEIQGANVVASRVRFVGGKPHKDGYRRYKIKSVEGQDDFASMNEVVSRSLKRGLEEDDLPDLMVIDGGKGQLNAALEARDELGAWDVQIVGLAKDRQKEKGGKIYHTGERVFLPGEKQSIPLPTGTPERLLLERIRNEAHRFAITFHRKKRETIRSELDGIPGLGPTRKKRLLKEFGSVQGIREKAPEDLNRIAGIPRSLAEAIWNHLRNLEKNS